MSEQPERPNWFVRTCTITFLIFVGVITVCSFWFGPDHFSITAGLLSILGLMIVALLAESFNSISFGSLLRLRRDIAKVETEKKEAKDEVRDLRASLFTLATTVQQSQATYNISGLDVVTLRKVLGVVEATSEDIKKDNEDAIPPKAALPEADKKEEDDSFEFRRKLQKTIQDDLLVRFTEKYKIPPLELRRQVKFESGLENADPIMSRPTVYHAYVKTAQKEYFIDFGPIMFGGGLVSATHDQGLYVRLARIFFYKQIKKVEAELVYLEVTLPESANKRGTRRVYGKVADTFQPAISNNLLRLESINITEQEFSELKEKAKKRADL